MKILQQPPRFLFVTGKGGVGKTSIACATAVLLEPLIKVKSPIKGLNKNLIYKAIRES
ncbi:ArsA-related P-loop ATPase [Legionella lytica]|uniref:ArsA-related P-loop ATPase n=1 Tax=Legionella lytica TaxID=96232 RepID=UPI002ADD92FB|nr:ArsA-related P-loop ATPase [Legionella lytica]